MFLYKKVNINDFTRNEPKEYYEEVFVISAITDNSAPDDEVFFFDIGNLIVNKDGKRYDLSGYMRGIVSKRVMEEEKLYLVISDIPGYERFFIEPVIYESIDEEELNLILHETIEFMGRAEGTYATEDEEDFEFSLKLDISDGNDFLEELDEFEDFEFIYDDNLEYVEDFSEPSNLDLLESTSEINIPRVSHTHSDELGLFELAGPLREQFGKRFITSNDTLQFAQSLSDFREQGNYIYHHEPALYAINKNLLVFANSDDLADEKFRILTVDKEEELMEVVRYRIVDSMDLMKLMNVSIRDSSTMFEIRKKLFELIYYMQ